MADRDRNRPGRPPPFDQEPARHHQGTPGPRRRRNHPQATRAQSQRRLRGVLALSPRPRTTPRPPSPLPQPHPPDHMNLTPGHLERAAPAPRCVLAIAPRYRKRAADGGVLLAHGGAELTGNAGSSGVADVARSGGRREREPRRQPPARLFVPREISHVAKAPRRVAAGRSNSEVPSMPQHLSAAGMNKQAGSHRSQGCSPSSGGK